MPVILITRPLDRLGQCRVNVNRLRNPGDWNSCFHGQHKFVEEFAGVGPKKVGPQNLILLVRNQFDQAVPLSFDHGPVDFVKFESEDLNIFLTVLFLRLLLRQPDPPQLGISVGDPRDNTVVRFPIHKRKKGV